MWSALLKPPAGLTCTGASPHLIGSPSMQILSRQRGTGRVFSYLGSVKCIFHVFSSDFVMFLVMTEPSFSQSYTVLIY